MSSNRMPGRTERGVSMIVLLMVVVIAFFFLTALFRIVPVYIDDYKLDSMIQNLNDPDRRRRVEDARDVRDTLSKQIEMENISGVKVSEMDIQYGNELLTIDFEYEVRTPFMGNVDAILRFEHRHELRVP